MQTVVGLYGSVAEAKQAKQALLDQGFNSSDVRVIDQSDDDYGTGTSGTAASSTGAYGTTTGMRATGSLPATDNDSTVLGLTGSNAGGIGQTGTSAYDRTSTTGYDQTSTTGYDRGTGTGYDRSNTDTNDTGVGAKIKHFFENLTGHDEHTHRTYTEGVSRGGALVAVHVNDNEVDRASGLLRQYGATDIDRDNDSSYGSSTGTTGTQALTDSDYRDAGYGSASGTTGTTAGATAGYGEQGRGSLTGEQVIPVVQENLQVGKREVERGGVRVYSHVVSQPVTESVNLHEEQVVVDRRPVDRPATEADFRDAGPIEVRATGEEAVVAKTGRVVEEVVVGKTVNDRTEQVEESVRRTEVDVQPVGTGANTRGSNIGDTGRTGSGSGNTGDNF